MVRELGLAEGQYRTREDDGLGEQQLQAIERAVDECRFTVLIASSAARWDKLAGLAAGLAQHAGLEDGVPRLIIIARDFAPSSEAERARLSLGQRAMVGLDCSDDEQATAALARLRKLLALDAPVDERPACPYPGLARFTAANRDLLFGRDKAKDAIVQRIRAGHSRILVVGPSGSGKSSLIHAAVLPELPPTDHVVRVVPRGGDLVAALRGTIDALEVPELGAAADSYLVAARGATDAQIEAARTRLRALPVPDARRRIVVVDPLEEVFAKDDATERDTLFYLLGGLWSLPWCTVILCMRADFYGSLMVERCWRELEGSQYPVAPLDETGCRAAIIEPAKRVGVHIDAALVERLIREIDRDRSSAALPLLQVALKELWAHLRWRYLTLADYELIVNHDQRGLAAVLAVHADSVMQRLTAHGDRAVAQRILLDLVHLGEGRPHTRRRRALEDLRRSGDAPEQLKRVLDQLIEGRLVAIGDGAGDGGRDGKRAITAGEAVRLGRYIDLAHDTLITGWPGLAGWIAERRDALRTQRRLEMRAESRELLTDSELPEFTRWLKWVATPEGATLGASDALRTLVQRSLVARRLRRGGLWAGLAVATTIAIIAASAVLVARAQEHNALQATAFAAEALTGDVASDLQARVDDVVKLASHHPEISPEPGPGRDDAEAWLAEVRKYGSTQFEDLWLFDTEGRLIAQTDGANGDPLKNIGKYYCWRDYFQGAKRLMSSDAVPVGYIFRVVKFEADGHYKFGVSAPFYDTHGKWRGVVAANIATSPIAGAFANARVVGHGSKENAKDHATAAVLVAPQDSSRDDVRPKDTYVVIGHYGLKKRGDGVRARARAAAVPSDTA
jgi:hypothetical protein